MKELIAKLQEYPEHLEVMRYIHNDPGYNAEILDVTREKKYSYVESSSIEIISIH